MEISYETRGNKNGFYRYAYKLNEDGERSKDGVPDGRIGPFIHASEADMMKFHAKTERWFV